MPVTMTAQQQADLNDPDIAKDVVLCLSMETVEGVLRTCNRNHEVTYLGDVYEAGYSQWWLDGPLSSGTALVSDPFTILFDGALQNDDTSLIGRLLDRNWHQRRLSLFLLMYRVDNGAFILETRNFRASMDTIEVGDQVGAESRVALSCESGTFRAVDRRDSRCTDEDQRRRAPSDTFFKNIAIKGTQPVPFGTSWSNVPGFAGASNGVVGGGGGFGGRFF